MATTMSALQKILELAEKFVTKQKGAWEHDEWEAFLAKAAQAGLDVNDESKRNLGNILEGLKYFYSVLPAPAKKASPKAKAKAKAKPKA